MERGLFSVLVSLLLVLPTACSTGPGQGNARLPDGIEHAQLPQADAGGYLYFKSDPPLTLSGEGFASGRPASQLPQAIALEQATIIVDRALVEFGGVLAFPSEGDALTASEMMRPSAERGELWSQLASPHMLLVRGGGEWSRAVRAALEQGRMTPLKDYDAQGWALLTNLPASPPSEPVAAGVMRLNADVATALEARTGVALQGVGNALGFVRVDKLAFAVYKDGPIEVSTRIDDRYLVESDASILLISQSAYTGGLVAFMLSTIAERTDMDLIRLGSTNARYRTIGDLHLILKNRGSLVYAAVAGTRQEAEELMLSALGGQRQGSASE